VQYGTVASLEENFKTIQLNVIRQTEINSIKAKKFIDNFGAISNYWSVISVYFYIYTLRIGGSRR